MIHKNALPLFLFICFISCNSSTSEKGLNDKNKIQKMEWLLGSWKNISPEGEMYEIWTKKNDSVYSGHGFMTVNHDTVFSERISLEQKKSGLFYIPVVKNQNAGQSVSFKLVSDSAGQFTFENKEHDFPQRVIYKAAGADSLYARIEGMDKGTFRREEFPLKKEK
jgi:hypothetical protein